MAGTYGRSAWEKYFSYRNVNTKLKMPVAVNGFEYDVGTDITVRAQAEYTTKVMALFPCGTEQLVSFHKIKKPIENTLMAIPFKPSQLGLDGSNKITDYIELLRENIKKKVKNEVSKVMFAIVDIVDWNSSKTAKKNAFDMIQDPEHIHIATKHQAEIQKHFLEAIGPIYVCGRKLANTNKNNSIITFSDNQNFKEYDFLIETGKNKTRFTAKGLTGTTNTLKVDNIVKRIYEDPKLKSKWKNTKAFELLEVVSGYDPKSHKLSPVRHLGLDGAEYLNKEFNVKIPAESVRTKYRDMTSGAGWHDHAAKYEKIVLNYVNTNSQLHSDMNEIVADYFGGDMMVIKGGFNPRASQDMVDFHIDNVPAVTMRNKPGERLGFLF